MKYSEFIEAVELLGVPPGTSLEGVKEVYRRRVKEGNYRDLAELNRAYRLVVEFCSHYPFGFSKEEFYKAFPEEAVRDGFYNHPLWEGG
ncbi:MAG: hypothetical protein DRI92_05285 [Aquificota bacterium]|nr:MAG: hypothetical protein DRI92_05285 [Aquificota bacterium]